jgi:hypothetical protein
MVVDNPAGPVLEFLTFTSLPHRKDGDAQRLVRSHAIRDVYRRKQLGAGIEPKRVRGAGTAGPPSQSSLTSKFKLNKKSAKPEEHVPAKDEERRDRRLSHRDPQMLFYPSLSIAIGPGIFDPFDTLGVKLGPRQKALLDYRRLIPWCLSDMNLHNFSCVC